MCHLTPTPEIQIQKPLPPSLPSSPPPLAWTTKTRDFLAKTPVGPHGFTFYFVTDISVLYGLFVLFKIWGSVFIWTSFKYLHIFYFLISDISSFHTRKTLRL